MKVQTWEITLHYVQLQWDTFFAVLFSNTDVSTLIDSDIVVVREPTYFENLDVVLARTNPTTVGESIDEV